MHESEEKSTYILPVALPKTKHKDMHMTWKKKTPQKSKQKKILETTPRLMRHQEAISRCGCSSRGLQFARMSWPNNSRCRSIARSATQPILLA